MAIKRHEKPCVQCGHFSVIMKGRNRCQRPIAAAACPVDGLKITHLDRSAYSERSNDWSLFGRQKCGPDGRYFKEGRSGQFPSPPATPAWEIGQ
ncbi:hypothetical protein FHW96_002333 [Novosphingobium sp. SG751A]|nr:hypothetical protein [Novosphingobium sp. SG751A]